jgi:hypothetical protein
MGQTVGSPDREFRHGRTLGRNYNPPPKLRRKILSAKAGNVSIKPPRAPDVSSRTTSSARSVSPTTDTGLASGKAIAWIPLAAILAVISS